jgi:hypothetical protein
LKAFKYLIAMKWKSAIIEFSKGFIVLFLGQVIIYTLVDLWVPMKRMVSGEAIPFDEIMAYIQFTGRWVVIFSVAIGVSLSATRRFLKNPSRQSDQRPAKKRAKQN